MEIRDRVVLITGASAGIGLATVRRFAKEGARLALVARSTEKLQEIRNELRGQGHEALIVTADMRNAGQVRRAVEETFGHFGRLDVLINNAGQAVAGRIEELDHDAFRQVIDLNIFGPLVAMQAAIPVMREQGGGIIVNISSMVSKMHIPGLAGYAATKAALNIISDTARAELAAEQIRVITVYPRLTATDFGKNSLGNQQVRQQQRQYSPVAADSAEFVAEKILSAVQHEVEEQYMQ